MKKFYFNWCLIIFNLFAIVINARADEISDLIEEYNILKQFDENNDEWQEYSYAEILLINKITAKSNQIIVKKDFYSISDNIKITLKLCQKPLSLLSNSKARALITINMKQNDRESIIFSGWMFSYSALTSIESPIYDVILADCHNSSLINSN